MGILSPLCRSTRGHTSSPPAKRLYPGNSTGTEAYDEVTHSIEQPPTSFTEHSNAEDYEFDESQAFDNSTDGMGFLTVDPRKAGYMGPQSGIAALKFLQSLPLYVPLASFGPSPSLDDDHKEEPGSVSSRVEISRYLDDYFNFYHPAYPILHEGTFRARVSGNINHPVTTSGRAT